MNIAQTLNGQELTYEITTLTGLARLAHIFSNTNLTVKTEDGRSVSSSGSPVDTILETAAGRIQ